MKSEFLALSAQSPVVLTTSLRQAGVKVTVVHYRRSKELPGLIPSLDVPAGSHEAKGGATEVKITLNFPAKPVDSQTQTFVGRANVSPKDSFVRRLGFVKAFGRAISDAKQHGVDLKKLVLG
jgi:hypothetical protein